MFSTGLMTSYPTLCHQEPTFVFFPSTGHAMFSQSTKASFLIGILVKYGTSIQLLHTTPPHVHPSPPFEKAPTMSFPDTMCTWAVPSSLAFVSLTFPQTSPTKLHDLQLSLHKCCDCDSSLGSGCPFSLRDLSILADYLKTQLPCCGIS